MDWGLVI
jgi:hypothetical protein